MDRCKISLSMLEGGDSLEQVKYLCPFCDCLLDDAVQTICGHWLCHDCAQQLLTRPTPHCPKHGCGELLKDEDGGTSFFPDRCARREVARIKVCCVNRDKDCTWVGPATELSDHLISCQYRMIQCQVCSEYIPFAELSIHMESCSEVQEACPFADTGCKQTKKMKRADLCKHLAGDAGLLQHFKIVAQSIKEVSIAAYEASSGDPGKDPVREYAYFSEIIKSLSRQAKEIELLKSEMAEKDDIISGFQSMLAKNVDVIHCLRDRLKQLELTQVESSSNEDHDFRLSILENTNFDGTMIWKISNFSQIMDDARTGRQISLFSIPFFTSRFGYKMCLRLYPLGDGAGKGTHMSLFMAMMQGEFDNLLQWPFTYKVTLMLVNQMRGRDIIDCLRPDPRLKSFQKPTSVMNAAAGKTRFVSIQELLAGGFVIDDTVFIKVIVDLSNVKHP